MEPQADIIDRPEAESVPGYQYYDDQLNVIWVTSVPKDDEAAIAYFHSLMRMSEGFRPKYVARRQPDNTYKALKVTFDCETYTTEDRR